MIMGHLPGGFLLSHALARPMAPRQQREETALLLKLGLLASVLPDFDLIYFYLVDKQQHLHHGYWTHIPAFWLVVFGVSWPLFRWFGGVLWGRVVLMMFLNLQLHLVLDSLNGGVRWLYPYSKASLNLIAVPAKYDWWVWNFVFHWSFALELVLAFLAGWVWFKQYRHKAF